VIAYALQRLAVAAFVVLVVSLLTFAFANVAVDPARAIAGEGATDQDIAAVRVQYGFDRPLYRQYLAWLGGSLTGDFGISIRQRRPVTEILAEAFPITLTLGVSALILALAVALPLGVVAALHPNSWIDRVAQTLAVIGMAMPAFWLGLLMILLFGVRLRWLPISGTGSVAHYIMPAITLATYAIPIIMRLTRAGMIEVLAADYVRTARAKGLLPGSVLFKHALRNAMMPVVAVTAVQFGYLLAGSVVIETLFALHGIGFLAWQSINAADLPIVQAIVLILSMSYVGLVFAADLLNALLDPRIRLA
jgi:peptide/nickel transport system permease protein